MKNGKYLLVKCPDGYPGKWYRGKYAYEHIVEFWRREGRLPMPGHVIHHKNENPHDNSWDNLEEMLREAHTAQHQPDRPIRHGTHTGYRRGCRCEECKAYHTAEIQQYRLRKKQATALVAQG